MKSFLRFAFVVVLLAAGRGVMAGEPSGASLAFTSRDPVVLQALDLVNAGKFSEAETLLAANTNGTAVALQARAEAAEIIGRVRVEYSLDTDGLLQKVKKFIPDATASEVERWATESRARYRMIDG